MQNFKLVNKELFGDAANVHAGAAHTNSTVVCHGHLGAVLGRDTRRTDTTGASSYDKQIILVVVTLGAGGHGPHKRWQ